MANASKDGNNVSTIIGVSTSDFKTPITVAVDPATHQLQTNSTGGGGGLSVVDEAAFTAATSNFTPGGGVFNDSVAALTSGQQGTFRLTANRAIHNNLRDALGNEMKAQKTMANSLPVVIASDQSNLPVQQQDGTATGTITSTENVSIALNGASSLGIILEGGFGGQVNFEGSIDGGTNWFTANAMSVPGDGLQQTAGNSGQFVAPVAGFSHFRVRGNTVNTATCTVFMRSSAGASNRIMNNAVINVNVQNFGIGQFGNQDNTNAGITSAVAWSGNLLYNKVNDQWERQRTPTTFKTIALTAATAETTIWTPTSGKKFRLMGFMLTPGAASTLTFKDNTAGTTIFATRGATDQPIITPASMMNGILSVAANNVLTVTRGTSATLDGVVFGTED